MINFAPPPMLRRSVTLAFSKGQGLVSSHHSWSLISAAGAGQERPRHEQWPDGAPALHPEAQHRPGGARGEDGQGAGAD